ncbi:Galactosylgalactosylxylosylprotein 3-beta-glucuronosyltransferase [Aphelenchoides fujianensis]|nr:Galactosylgalactosylxylosylprotein 3-beta-glucuronosyltransferase [Aphelenchoides fujianensis]
MFPDQRPSVKVRFLGRRLAIALGLLLVFCTYAFLVPLRSVWSTPSAPSLPEVNGATIFVITPTYPRPERFAVMTRTTQTLMQVSNLFWIVVEDGEPSPVVQRMLDRSGIPHVYLNTTSNPALPVHGWSQRNLALTYLRENYAREDDGVVYFADDDNAYDIRLFNQYIRRVKKIGFWAVGFVGAAKVEAPHVVNGTITKWDTIYEPDRKFATDMAGFAVNIRLILNSNASFGKQCNKRNPEDCFIRQLGVNVSDTEPFGHDSEPKELLVWHTKSSVGYILGASYDYAFETRRPPLTTSTTVKKALNQTTRSSARPRRRASRPST